MVSDRIWRRILGLSAALFLLNASLTFESAWPTPGIRWRGPLSIELAVCVLAMLVISMSRRRALSRPTLGWLAVVWSILVVGRYAEVTASALYGREINLFWDLRFVPDVAVMLAAPSRLWTIALATLGVILILALLYRVLRWALRSIADATTRPIERRALYAVVAVVGALWAGQRLGASFAEGVRFSAPVSATYARQARLLVSSLTGSMTLPAGPAMNSDLSRVKGADVFVFFIEAYGAISYERPEFVARLAADRAAFESVLRETHREVVSAFVESPTFGGSSWLAHITLLGHRN